MADKALPLVYSCSGCSSAAQLANAVALRLDRDGTAEMSCIAGVGGGVAPLVKLAQSGRTILAIDGCPLACARECPAKLASVGRKLVCADALAQAEIVNQRIIFDETMT